MAKKKTTGGTTAGRIPGSRSAARVGRSKLYKRSVVAQAKPNHPELNIGEGDEEAGWRDSGTPARGAPRKRAAPRAKARPKR